MHLSPDALSQALAPWEALALARWLDPTQEPAWAARPALGWAATLAPAQAPTLALEQAQAWVPLPAVW